MCLLMHDAFRYCTATHGRHGLWRLYSCIWRVHLQEAISGVNVTDNDNSCFQCYGILTTSRSSLFPHRKRAYIANMDLRHVRNKTLTQCVLKSAITVVEFSSESLCAPSGVLCQGQARVNMPLFPDSLCVNHARPCVHNATFRRPHFWSSAPWQPRGEPTNGNDGN